MKSAWCHERKTTAHVVMTPHATSEWGEGEWKLGSLQPVWAPWQWSGVPHLAGTVAPTSEQWRPRRFIWRSCLLRVWDFSTTCFFNVLLVTAWVRWEVSEPRLNILCDLVFKPTPSEEDLTVTRSWVLMSSSVLFISYAACKWNHWQVLFINDEAITRKMGAHTEGHNRFQ